MGKLILNAPDPVTGIDGLFKNFFLAGWGKMRIEDLIIDLLQNYKPVTVIEENGFYTYLSQKEGAQHLSPFFKGVLTGVFDILRKREHTCEMKMVSKNPLVCKYTVSPLG